MIPQAILKAPGIERLGWTLAHFVWQGLLLALALIVVLHLLRNAKAQTRYIAALGGLCLMALAPLLTFMLIEPIDRPAANLPQISPAANAFFDRWMTQLEENAKQAAGTDASAGAPGTPVAAANKQSTQTGGAQKQPTLAAAPEISGWRSRIEAQFKRLLPWMTLAWLLGVVALSIRHMTAWRLTHRLRRRWVKPVAPHLRETLIRLSERMGVRRAVGLLESAVIEVPSMIGCFKPLILLPASALTGLPPAQIEQILAHELAHVRRHDYLTNLMQTIIETLLFYHPAVWWLGAQVRSLREHCCDDLVVEVLGDARGYAQALTRMEELRVESSDFAMALTGGTLMERIRRILGMQTRESNGDRWFAGLITALLVILAGSWLAVYQPSAAQAAGEVEASINKDLKSQPGYVELQALPALGKVEAAVEVMLPKVLLNMKLQAAKSANPELANLTEGLDLDLVHVKVYNQLGENSAAVKTSVNQQVGVLLQGGWLPILRVPEQNINVLLRVEGEKLLGVVVLVAPENQLIFVNVVGNVDSAKLGEKIGMVLNKSMSGGMALEDLMDELMGSIQGSLSEATFEEQQGTDLQYTPTGFKARLEIESMQFSGALLSDDAALDSGKAVYIDRIDSRISGSIRLEPGIYQATLYMLTPDPEHDAVVMQIDQKPSIRAYRAGGSGWGPATQGVMFELREAREVQVVINGAESGMLIDCIQFVQVQRSTPKEVSSRSELQANESIGGMNDSEIARKIYTLLAERNSEAALSLIDQALDRLETIPEQVTLKSREFRSYNELQLKGTAPTQKVLDAFTQELKQLPWELVVRLSNVAMINPGNGAEPVWEFEMECIFPDRKITQTQLQNF